MKSFLKVSLAAVALTLLLAGCKERVEWMKVVFPEGRLTVLMPGEPDEMKKEVPAADGGTVEVFTFTSRLGPSEYAVYYSDIPAADLSSLGFDDLLLQARDRAVAAVDGKLLEEKKITLGDYPGVEFKVKGKDFIDVLRLYIVEGRLYQLGVVTPEADTGSPEIDRFLNSFKLM